MGADNGKRSPSQVDLELHGAYPGETASSHVKAIKQDAVFGEIDGESGPDYRSVCQGPTRDH